MTNNRIPGPALRVRSAINRPATTEAFGRPISEGFDDCCHYGHALDRQLSAGRITDKMRLVALATYELSVQEHLTPTRAEIAARVSLRSPCSVSTVENAHKRLRELGMLEWDAQHDIFVRRVKGGFGPVPLRAANAYQFSLPSNPLPLSPVRTASAIQGSRRLHSRDRPRTQRPFLDRKISGVSSKDKISYSSSTLKSQQPSRFQVVMDEYTADTKERQARMLVEHRSQSQRDGNGVSKGGIRGPGRG